MDNHFSINFDSHIPYYIQLMEILKDQISQNKWQPGDQISGEQELCETYGISRTVVRQALRELEFEGIINRRKGKGTFVSIPKINEGLIQKLTGFYQDMIERGHTPGTKVLHQRTIGASEKIANYLEIKPGTKVIDIQRLRFIDNEPIQLVTTYIPFALCPGLIDVDLTHGSLYKYMEQEYGLFLERGRRTIESVLCNEAEALLLEIEKGAPLLLLDSVSYAENDKPIEYYHALHRGDRSRFEVELVRMRDGSQPRPKINVPFTDNRSDQKA
ncbi:MAG: GntR family transcriptional regulator [Anaerolineaceae bacterium]|nr:GntR family transcriptional regulator [Anaerolineaceae bacterium]